MSYVSRFAALAVLTAVIGATAETPGALRARRADLSARHADGAIVLLGYDAAEGRPGPSPFRQEDNFYYLTGCNTPNAALLLLPERGSEPYREILFLPEVRRSDVMWDVHGPDPHAPDAAAKFGVDEVRTREGLDRLVKKFSSRYERVYTVLPAGHEGVGSPYEPSRRSRVGALVPDAALEDLRASLTELRMIKSADELRLIQRATDATVAAHLAAWRMIRPGLEEYQVAAEMTYVLFDRGCERHAYAPIVGSGANSLILHYNENRKKIEDGDLALIDVGGEFEHYAADVTRTVPVSGHFTPRQREIYDLVLAANRAVLAAVKPGMRLSGDGPRSLSRIAQQVFEKAKPGLSKRFPHSVGHYVGLAVHDPGSQYADLEEGMVITIEPGLYFPEEGWGVRIEDMALVTADGARLLTAALPSDADEIERIMAER